MSKFDKSRGSGSFRKDDKGKKPFNREGKAWGDKDRNEKKFKRKDDSDRPFKRERDGDSSYKSKRSFSRDGDKDKKPFNRENKTWKNKDRSNNDSGENKFRRKDDERGEKKSYRKTFSRDGDRDKKPFNRENKTWKNKDRSDDEGSENKFRRKDDNGGEKKSYKRSFSRDDDKGKRPWKDKNSDDNGRTDNKFRRRDDSDKSFRREKDSRDDKENEDEEKKSYKEKRSFTRNKELRKGGGFKKEFGHKTSSGHTRPFKKSYDNKDSEGSDDRRKEFSKKPFKKDYSGGEERRVKYDEFEEGKSFSEEYRNKDFKEKKSSLKNKGKSDDGLTRLNKYLANAGIASRREADVLIKSGVVKVNGVPVTEMGFKVKPGDTVTYGDAPVKGERKVYLLLNKPKDYITTVDDPQQRKTVMELIDGACKERVYPVGRLDRNTTGLLLLTNDGELTKKLTHPKHEIKKVYHISLSKGLKPEDFKSIIEGVELEDGPISADDLAFVGEGKKEVGIEIHSGRNRIVRRLFEHLGYEVLKLDRVMFAGLTKKDLPRGKYRFLTQKEVNFLQMIG
jgi:23S rRNA pseudouridine2605 synthase